MRSIICMLMLALAGASNAQVVTLDSVLRTIDRSYPMLKSYDAMAASHAAYSQGASSWMPPKFTAGLWQAPYTAPGTGMLMFGIEQMIPNPSKTSAKAAMIQSEAAIDTTSRSSERNSLYARAKQSYYEWSVLKRKVTVLAETDSLLAFIIRVATERYPSGKEQLENIYEAKAARADLASMRLNVNAAIRIKNIELNTVQNLDAHQLYDIDTTLPRIDLSLTPDTNYFQTHRSDIRAIDAQIASLQTKREYAHSMLYPDFGISATHGIEAQASMGNRFTVMAMITVPIAPWSRGEADAMTNGIDDEITGLRLKEEAKLREVTSEAAMLRVQLTSAREQLANYEANTITAYAKAFDATLSAYAENRGDLFRVLSAWKMLQSAELNRLDQLQTIMNAQVRYEQALEIN